MKHQRRIPFMVLIETSLGQLIKVNMDDGWDRYNKVTSQY